MLIDRRTVVGGLLVAPVLVGSAATVVAAKEVGTNPAEMMHRALARHRVEVLPVDTGNMKEGMRLGMPPTHGGLWTQRHVDGVAENFNQEGAVWILAGHISSYFRRIRFGHLVVPSKGCMDAARHTFGDVTLRNLSAYSPWVDEEGRFHDEIVRRIDVLFVGES